MSDAKKQKIPPPQSPLAKAARDGFLGVEKKPINGDSDHVPALLPQKEAEPGPMPSKEAEPTQAPESKTEEKKRRITAYVAPDIYTWSKHQAVTEDKDLSAIIESALRMYKASKDSGSK